MHAACTDRSRSETAVWASLHDTTARTTTTTQTIRASKKTDRTDAGLSKTVRQPVVLFFVYFFVPTPQGRFTSAILL